MTWKEGSHSIRVAIQEAERSGQTHKTPLLWERRFGVLHRPLAS